MTSTTKAKKDRAAEALQSLTSQVIEAIETNPGQWTKPWSDTIATSGMPTNTAGKAYSGGNVILALSAQIEHRYSTGIWGTWNQWADALGQPRKGGKVVRKGERATYLLRPEIVKIRKDENGNPLPKDKERTFTLFKGFAVFNASQVEGGEEWALATFGPTETVDPIEAAERFIDATGADITHGPGGAFYQPTGDYINLPRLAQYKDAVAYYSTAVHELGHWTGAAKRLNRPGVTTSGSEKTKAMYAFEELIAELTSVLVGAGQLGLTVEPRVENVQYLAHWVQAMKENPKVLWKAASGAAKAAAYLGELQPAEELVAA